MLCRMYWANGSSDKLEMAGDAGQPCLLKRSERCPAVTTLAEGLEYKICIILIKFGSNLNFSKTFHRYPRSKRSNVFSASRNRSPPGKPVFLASAMTCKSWRTLSDANHPLRKPVWSGLINFPTTLSRHIAIILE